MKVFLVTLLLTIEVMFLVGACDVEEDPKTESKDSASDGTDDSDKDSASSGGDGDVDADTDVDADADADGDADSDTCGDRDRDDYPDPQIRDVETLNDVGIE